MPEPTHAPAATLWVNTSSALQLEVKGAAPVSAQVTALGSTLLALSWEPPPPQLTGQLVSYQVEYGVSGSLERQIRSSSGTETRQLVLPNLEEGTSYEFAVRGVYQGGIAGVDFTVLGSTLETAPTGPPRNLTLTPLEEAIRVSWLPPLLEDQNGRLTFYHVHYRESPRTVDNSFNFLTVSVLPTNATTNVSSDQLEEFDLPNLVGGRSYDIKIQAATAVGNGPNSTVLTATALIPFPLTLVLAITIPVGSVLLLLLLLLLSCLCVWGWQRHSRRGKHSPLVEDEAFERQLNKKGRVQKNAISGPIPGIAPTIDTSVSSKFTGRGKAGRVLHLKPKIITAADVAMPPSPGETVQKVSQRDIFPSRGFSQEAQRDETEFQASPDEEGSAEHIAPYASVQYGAARMGGWKAADIWDQPIHEEEEGEEEEGEREALEEMDDMGISESSNGDPGDELSASRNALDLSLENVSIQPQMAPTLDPHHTDPSPESSRDDVNLVYSTVPQGYLQKKRARRLKEQQAQEAKARRSHQRMQERIRKEQRKRDERERKAMEKETRRHAKDETTRKELGLENVVRLHEVDLSSRQGRAQAQFIDAATAAIF